MRYIKRDLEDKIIALSKEYACSLITGPRQVGKTTILKQLMDNNREYVTLDNLEDRQLAKNEPATFFALHDTPIFIDEVQYAPELFSYIKIAVDNGAAPGSFWLTGSQAFKMMELAQESLAGRVAILHMPTLSQHEIYGIGENTPFSINLTALKERKANRIFVFSTFGLFTNGLAKFDEAYAKGHITRVLTTNLIYQSPELLDREWYISCDMSKYIAYIVDTLNHDSSISDLLNPVERIQNIVTQYKAGKLK